MTSDPLVAPDRLHRSAEASITPAASPASTKMNGACLVCGSDGVTPFLDLGRTALANRFLSRLELGEPEPRHPLRVGFCSGCTHVQLMERVPPPRMFEEYLYVSSASDTLRCHFSTLCELLIERLGLGSDDLVVDIGCNDASLLREFRRRGIRTLGVDPARNLASFPGADEVERYVGFFDADTAPEIVRRWGRASLVIATNTFPHIPGLRAFARGIDTLLAPGGTFVLETHYLVDLLEGLAFDTIYPEHVSYWALGPMVRLFRECGLEVVDAARLPLHHGQLRVYVQRAGTSPPTSAVEDLLFLERTRGLDNLATYHWFAHRVENVREELRKTLLGLKTAGHTLAAYGAPAKGSTLLEFAGIGPDLLDFIADRSPLKQGHYMPGSHIPIVPPERLREERPDYVLLLAWNFASEILEQQADYLAAGGRFILPLPEVRVL